MGFIDRVFALLNLRRRSEEEPKTDTPELRSIGISSPTAARLFGISESGVNVNRETALTLTAFFRAVAIRANLVATLPRKVFEIEPDGDTRELRQHPVNVLLTVMPGHIYTPFQFWSSMEASSLIFGGAGAEIVRDQNGRPARLRLFRFGASIWQSTDDGEIFVVDNETGKLFFLDDVLYLPGLMLTDGIRSRSLIAYFSEVLGEQLSARLFVNTLWKNGPFLGGVYTYVGRKKDDPEAFALDLRNYLGGAGRAGLVLPIPNGDKFEQLQPVDMSKAQLIEQRKFGIEEVARMTGVPVSLLMELEKPSYNSLSQLFLQFKITTLDPRLTQIDQELTRKLIPARELGRVYVETEIDELLWASPTERAEYWERLFKMAAITPNEIRRYLNRPGVANGDTPFVMTNNLTPLDQLGAGVNPDNDVNPEPQPAPEED